MTAFTSRSRRAWQPLEGERGRYVCVLDSGATHSITGDKSLYEGVVASDNVAIDGIGDGVVATAKGKGSVIIGGQLIKGNHLLFVPAFPYTLLSVRDICECGFDVTFTKHGCSMG